MGTLAQRDSEQGSAAEKPAAITFYLVYFGLLSLLVFSFSCVLSKAEACDRLSVQAIGILSYWLPLLLHFPFANGVLVFLRPLRHIFLATIICRNRSASSWLQFSQNMLCNQEEEGDLTLEIHSSAWLCLHGDLPI